MHPTQLLMLFTAICFCALIAHRFRVAMPIVLLLGGVALALLSDMQQIEISPEHMLLIFLPPILMEAAFFTSIRDLKMESRAILMMAVGLVIFTTLVIGAVFVQLLPGASWPLGFVLGAIISPPDAAAAIGAVKGIRLPKRVLIILEGESLVNDASGIVLYKLAVGAVLAGSFSLADAGSLLVWKTLGGISIGLALAWLFVKIYPFLRDPSVEILSTFLPPYAAFLLAEHYGMSGVLAVVAAGLYVGWHAPRLFTPRMRIPAEAVWKMVVFFLNGVAFLIIGLQLPSLVQRLDVMNNPAILLLALVVCLVSVAVRFIWVYVMAYGLRHVLIRLGLESRDRIPSWQNVFVVGWTGMRGIVTLALALAIPLTLSDGSPFPYRDLIIFLSISIIIFTLVLQGISLPWLIRKLTLTFDPKRMEEEWHARVAAARDALTRLDELKTDTSVHMPALMRIREHYSERLESLGDGPNTPLHPDHAPGLMSHPLLQAENRLWAEVLKKERETLLRLRRDYTIGDDVMHDILREMDLLAARFHHEESHAEIHEQAERARDCRTVWCYKNWLRNWLFKSPASPA
jgi:CPA1 family monovalent cation:H+ antiporter